MKTTHLKCLLKLKIFLEEMEEYASMSWGEIVEREITHYRKPGDFAQIHEKLLSPSRRRFVCGDSCECFAFQIQTAFLILLFLFFY